jgi:hypothetical protein
MFLFRLLKSFLIQSCFALLFYLYSWKLCTWGKIFVTHQTTNILSCPLNIHVMKCTCYINCERENKTFYKCTCIYKLTKYIIFKQDCHSLKIISLNGLNVYTYRMIMAVNEMVLQYQSLYSSLLYFNKVYPKQMFLIH